MVTPVGARDHHKENHMEPETTRHRKPLRRLAVGVLIGLGASLIAASGAGASTACGEYSYGFAGTRLLNDGISNSAGPFAIDLPAGTYTVTLVSHDFHDEQDDVPTQPGEQYVVVLDSGYVSPPSNDIPDDQNDMTTTHAGQVVPASTAISVRHLGVPGINSVDVLCVGFTPEPSSDATTELPPETVPPAVPADTPSAEEPPPAVEAPSDETPAVEAPSDEEPTQDISEPVSIVREPPAPTPTTAAPSTPEPEVRGIVEEPADDVEIAGPVAQPAQLAITGPSLSSTLLLIGLSMIALGVGLVSRERKLS